MVAVTAGEAKKPDEAVPRAMRTMVFRLIIFYIGAMIVLVGMVPWMSIQPGARCDGESLRAGIPADPCSGRCNADELRGSDCRAFQHEL